MSTPTVAALLLAGGASTRMGSPKALLGFHGRALWRVQLEKLSALAPVELLISAPHDLAFTAGDWKVLRDLDPGLGPLAGLAAARREMSAEWLLVLAIDLPAMTPSYLRQLRDDAVAGQSGQVPLLDGRYLGLAAIYPRAFLDLADAHLRTGDRSIQRFVREGIETGALTARPVQESERPLFVDTNDPDTFALASLKFNDDRSKCPLT